MLKKAIIAAALCGAMAVSMAGCSGGEQTEPVEQQEPAQTEAAVQEQTEQQTTDGDTSVWSYDGMSVEYPSRWVLEENGEGTVTATGDNCVALFSVTPIGDGETSASSEAIANVMFGAMEDQGYTVSDPGEIGEGKYMSAIMLDTGNGYMTGYMSVLVDGGNVLQVMGMYNDQASEQEKDDMTEVASSISA